MKPSFTSKGSAMIGLPQSRHSSQSPFPSRASHARRPQDKDGWTSGALTRRLSPTRASTLSHRQCASRPRYKSRRLGLAPPRRASGVHRYILANLHRRLQLTCELRALSEIVEDHGFLEPIKPLLVESVAAQEGPHRA